MAFFAFPLAMVLLAAWLVVTWKMARAAMALVGNVPGRPLPQILAAAVTVAVCWLVPNIVGLQKSRAFSKISTDCGWTIYKKAPAVEGIYSDAAPRSHLPDSSGKYLAYYPKVQFQGRVGEVGEMVRGGKYVPIPRRTLRYGIRADREELHGNVQRYTMMVMDYDSNEVLAKYVDYDLSGRLNGKGVMAIAFDTVTVQPEGCKKTFEEFERQLTQVLPVAAAKP